MSERRIAKAVGLAEYALAERDALRDGTVDAQIAANLRCAAAGLSLLAELGAYAFGDGGGRPEVLLGEDAWTGRRLVERHEMLLRKLGWFVAEVERSHEPLRVAYRR